MRNVSGHSVGKIFAWIGMILCTLFLIMGIIEIFEIITYKGYRAPLYISERIQATKPDEPYVHDIVGQITNLTDEDVEITSITFRLTGVVRKEGKKTFYNEEKRSLYNITVPANGTYNIEIKDVVLLGVNHASAGMDEIIINGEKTHIRYSEDGISFENEKPPLTQSLIFTGIGVLGYSVMIIVKIQKKAKTRNEN